MAGEGTIIPLHLDPVLTHVQQGITMWETVEWAISS
jgi:hypothetical protein